MTAEETLSGGPGWLAGIPVVPRAHTSEIEQVPLCFRTETHSFGVEFGLKTTQPPATAKPAPGTIPLSGPLFLADLKNQRFRFEKIYPY